MSKSKDLGKKLSDEWTDRAKQVNKDMEDRAEATRKSKVDESSMATFAVTAYSVIKAIEADMASAGAKVKACNPGPFSGVMPPPTMQFAAGETYTWISYLVLSRPSGAADMANGIRSTDTFVGFARGVGGNKMNIVVAATRRLEDTAATVGEPFSSASEYTSATLRDLVEDAIERALKK